MDMFEEKLCYPALALIVLAVFYGIYFGKMLAQKRHGIRTHQIGRRRRSFADDRGRQYEERKFS